MSDKILQKKRQEKVIQKAKIQKEIPKTEQEESKDGEESLEYDEEVSDQDEENENEAIDYGIFSDNEEKRTGKRRKHKLPSRKLWNQQVRFNQMPNLLLQEDIAIEKLVEKYGTKRWTFIA